MFSMRIVTTSHYQAKPIPGLDTTRSEFRNTTIRRVPVLRIFGSTPAGQKTCMHVHGVFPYLFVPYDGTQPLDRYLRQFAASLDKALNVASRSTGTSFQHVYKISLVSGIPMYGYHPQEGQFLKIYLFNPNSVRKAADLLLGGAVMNKPFQPHESHVPYALQLFIDYNLYGMNLINVAALKFRKRSKDGKNDSRSSKSETDNLDKGAATPDRSLLHVSSSSTPASSVTSSPLDLVWHEENIPSEMWLPSSIDRQSTCELEVDVVAADITNRQDLASSAGANPGLTALWEDERQRRRNMGESSQLGPDSSQERIGVEPSENEKELLKRFLDIVKQQQAYSSSQLNDSLPSQPSLSVSRLESHVSREDSLTDSEKTVILGGNDDSEDKGSEDMDCPPIVDMNSIEKVVASSQSFCLKSSQRATPDSQDRSVADILAALLEESGPPPSQLSSLEDKDSILSQSIVLDEDEEKEEEEETLIMSQVVKGDEVEDSDDEERVSELSFDVAKLDEPWDSVEDVDIAMNTEDDDDSDEVDLLPQYDGASDKVTGSDKNSAQNIVPSSLTQNPGPSQGPGGATNSQVPDSSVTAWRGMGNSQDNLSWTQQGWPQQAGSGSGSWHGQSRAWSQQQQQYQNWPVHQQQMPSSPGFSSQQAAFQSPPTMRTFQSPPHNPFASPSHQQVYNTPSPSSSHPPFQYPPYQSSTSGQSYQQPHRSPSHLPVQSPGSNQSFHSPQSYSSLNQSYQSPPTSQPFSPFGTTVSQVYQQPGSNKPYTSPTGNQPYQSSSVNQPFQSPPVSQPYQSPPVGQPYQSPQHNPGYQPVSGHMYPSPYQSPQTQQTSPHQSFPPPYQSPGQGGGHYTPWGSQVYPGCYQGLAAGQGSIPQSSSGKNQGGTSQIPQSDTSFCQSDAPGCSDHSSQSQDLLVQQQSAVSGLQKQEGMTLSTSSPSSCQIAGHKTVIDQSNKTQQKKADKRGEESSQSDGFKSPQSLSLSPVTVVSKSTFDFGQQTSSVGSLESLSSQSLDCGVGFSHLGSQKMRIPNNSAEDGSKSAVSFGMKSPEPVSAAKISTLEFKPVVQASSSTAIASTEPSGCLSMAAPHSDNKTVSISAEKVETSTSTPMIQQLLMEEPVRMNIRKEDRDAVLKKPMASPTLQKPKKKYKSRTGQSGKKPGRPRSTSLTSQAPPAAGYYGYPQSVMSPPAVGQQRRSCASSTAFTRDSRMPSPMQNYSWQHQWKQQSFSPASPWQQQQLQPQWGMNIWPSYSNPGESGNSDETGGSSASTAGRLQSRSFSADNVQISTCKQNSQPDELLQLFENQINQQNNSTDIEQICIDKESVNDKSSLSSLFQLVSDVGSDDVGWESAPSAVVPSLFPNSSESETPKSTPTSDFTQGSPSVRDFITLETPCKQIYERANSDTAGMTSSEESDRMDLELSYDRKSRGISRSLSLGTGHPQLGNQGRLKRLGLIQTLNTDLGLVSSPVESNPAYTYTFHVPTPVFKKLKFFKSFKSRKHNVRVVRMHPMDARRYSLLKIGREIVKVVRLTEVDFAKHNVGLLPQSHYVSADGSSNRVNLDIPVVSVDKRSGDSGSEENSLSRFDTDFPPNKVAPPSSFHGSQVSASMTRSTSAVTRSSPVSSDWMRQYPGQQPANYNERFSPGSQQSSFGLQQVVANFGTFSGHQVPQTHINRQFGIHQSEDSCGLTLQQFSEKDSTFYPHSTSSCIHPPETYFPNQHNSSCYPQHQQYYQQHYQQQQQSYYLEQQPQAGYSSSDLEPKNGLRSPGQHGLASRIDGGSVPGHSGDHKPEHNDESATETSPLNTRVNAVRSDNHAEYMANCTATQDSNVCASTHWPVLEHPDSTGHVINTTGSVNIGEEIRPSEATNLFYERPSIKNKIGRLSLRNSGVIFHLSSHNNETDLNLTQNSPVNCGDLADNGMSWKKPLDNAVSLIPAVPAQSARMNHLNNSSSLNVDNGHRKHGTGWKKNIKALSLTIPEPQSGQNFLDCDGTLNSLDYMERESVVSSEEESEGSDGNNQGDQDGGDDFNESRVTSPCHRSERSVSPEEDTKYVNQECKLSLKAHRNMEKQESVIDRVHYFVMRKFRGHKSMLVKIDKVSVNPTQKVNAREFEELAAKDIVRIASSVSCQQDNMIHSDMSELLDCDGGSTEVPVESETLPAQIEGDIFAVGQREASTCHSFKRASRGRSLRYGKYRSARASLINQGEAFMKASTASPSVTSKAVLVDPMNGVSENASLYMHLAEDGFFFQFKENFIKKNMKKELGVDAVAEDHKNVFFLGVSSCVFHNFRQKFLANVQKLRSDEYSSSSDDEDDVLDKIILKDKLIIPQIFVIHEEDGDLTACEGEGQWCDTVDYDLCHQAIVDSRVFSFNCEKECSKDDDVNKSENTRESKQLLQHSRGTFATETSELTSSSEKLPESSFRYCLDNDSKFHKIGETVNERQPEDDRFSDNILKQNFSSTPTAVENDLNHHTNSASFSGMNANHHMNLVSFCDKNSNHHTIAVSVSDTDSNHHTNSVSFSDINSETRRDAEEKEDYLKRQMAFFEDISSESDSSGTIILDSFTGREVLSQSDPLSISSLPSFSASRLEELCASTAVVCEPPPSPTARKEQVAGMGKDVTSVDNCETFSDNAATHKLREQSKVPDSVVYQHDNADISEESLSSQMNSQSGIADEEQEMESPPPSQDAPLVCEFSDKGFSDAAENSLLKSTEDRDIHYESDEATIELDMGSGVLNKDPGENVFEELHSSKESDLASGKLLAKSVDSDPDMDTNISTDNSHRPRRHGKGMKKSKRDKGSKLVNRRQLLDDGNSSSNDEMVNLTESCAPSKVLRQRKQTFYTFYTDILDTTEEDSSDSSDEDFNSRGSHRKGPRQNRKQKSGSFKDGHIRKLHQPSLDKAAKNGQRSRLSRGKKKKPLGGDKLLNSLSLLHMATLANLNETQPDSLDSQSVSEISAQTENEHSWQYSARANNDHSATFTPSLEHMSFISPQNSDEVEISPPVASSPSDKAKLKQARRGHGDEDIAVSRRLLNSSRQISLKPGCNGASNLGSKPLPFSRLVTSSASPVPSNFSFNHILDTSQQLESLNQSEDLSTSGTLQLLETRRAQVNCASFSMKDILKLTTTDDSMDSDSKDGAALVRPPEPKRAQVKSTALSMSDILKLTCVDKSTEARSSPPTSHSILSLLSNSESHSAQSPQKHSKMPDFQLSAKSIQDFRELPGMCLDLPQKTDFTDPSSQTQVRPTESSNPELSFLTSAQNLSPSLENTEASQSLLLQMSNFGGQVSHSPGKCTDAHQESQQGKTEDPSKQESSCLTPEGNPSNRSCEAHGEAAQMKSIRGLIAVKCSNDSDTAQSIVKDGQKIQAAGIRDNRVDENKLLNASENPSYNSSCIAASEVSPSLVSHSEHHSGSLGETSLTETVSEASPPAGNRPVVCPLNAPLNLSNTEDQTAACGQQVKASASEKQNVPNHTTIGTTDSASQRPKIRDTSLTLVQKSDKIREILNQASSSMIHPQPSVTETNPHSSSKTHPQPNVSETHPHSSSKIHPQSSVTETHPHSSSKIHPQSSVTETNPHSSSKTHPQPSVTETHPHSSSMIHPQPSVTETHPHSSSMIHPQPSVTETNPLSSSKIHPQPSVTETHPHSSSMIHPQPSVTETHPHSSSKIHPQPSVTETHPHSSSKIHPQPSVTETHPLSSSKTHPQPSVTENHPHSSSKIHSQSSVTETHPHSSSKIHPQSSVTETNPHSSSKTYPQPSVTETHPHSSSMIHPQPSVTETHPHSSSKIHPQPSVTETHPHSSSKIHPQPSVTETHPHSSSKIHPQPSVTEAHPHSSSKIHPQPSVTETHPHSSSKIHPQPSVTETHPHSSSKIHPQPIVTETHPHSSSKIHPQPIVTETHPHSSSKIHSQSSVTETHPHSSVLEIPTISVTCDEAPVNERSEEGHVGSVSRKPGGDEAPNVLNMKTAETELKPLSPLQIPPYSYMGHCFGLQPGQIFHPSMYYPFCWQWSLHTPGSDSTVSPLNLCTIQRSPNSYSPITPTSPISPIYPSQTPDVGSSSLSPPRKKKPLWYPWLTVDYARSKPTSDVTTNIQRNKNNPLDSSITARNQGIYPSKQCAIEPNKAVVTSEHVHREASSSEPKSSPCTTKTSKKEQNCHSRIIDLLSSPPCARSSQRANSETDCQTVSQFLGSVIDTAYEHGRSGTKVSSSDRLLDGKVLSPTSSKTPSDDKQSACFRKYTEFPFLSPAVYVQRESTLSDTSYGLLKNKSRSHLPVSMEGHDQKLLKTSDLHNEDSLAAAKCTFENKQLKVSRANLRGKSLSAKSKSRNHFCTERRDLTERLITRLIKGDDHKYYHKDPAEAAGSSKHPNSTQRTSNDSSSQQSQMSRERHSQKCEKGEGEGDKEDGEGSVQNREAKENQSCESGCAVTLRPVKLAPSRSVIEKSLPVLGLNSVQPPVAFCSSPEDLPDRPVEHGGRVLKVESRRVCELSPFASSEHIVGVKTWRCQSLSSSKLLLSQSQGKPLWERLEQEPRLQCLLNGEQLVVVSPVRTPPSKAIVSKWLQGKVVAVKEVKAAEQSRQHGRIYAADDQQPIHDDSCTLKTGSQQSDICKDRDKETRLDVSIPKTAFSQTFSSEGDSSAYIGTKLDVSSALRTCSAKLTTPARTAVLPSPASPHTESHDIHFSRISLEPDNKRKRKLKYTDSNNDDGLEESSLSEINTLDEHFRKTKKKCASMEIQSDKLDNPLSSSATANSTPVRPSFKGMLEFPITPIHSLDHGPENTKHNASETDRKSSRSSQEMANVQQVSVLRHVSTTTENLVKNILTSQTQRQVSVPGPNDVSQIEGPTPKNTFGFKVAQTHVQDSKALHKYQYVTAFSLELQIETRGDLRPDPEFDAIQAVFYSVLSDIPPEKGKRSITGVIVVDLQSWQQIAERNEKDTSPDASEPTMSARSSAVHFTPSNLPPHGTGHANSASDSTTRDHFTSSSSQSASSAGQQKLQSSQPPPATSLSEKEREKSKESIPALPVGGAAFSTMLEKCGMDDVEVMYVKDEMDLFDTFSDLVVQFDPDILVGFEIQMLSWGYIFQRAAHLNVPLCSRVSRVQEAKDENRFSAEKDEWGADHMSEVHVSGRIVLNLWRILRHEVTLNVYSFENVAYHVLHQRIPLYSFRTLTKWYSHKTHLHRWRVFEHYLLRAKGQLDIMDQLDLIGKTSEFARVFGIEFYDVLARGSQIRVESMMLRIAKPMNFVPVSPSVSQRAHQRAAECNSLNLEPESKYYTSPVAVLDFQSLYPSIMIAYNYCFSTCLGRLTFLQNAHEGPFEFGCTSLSHRAATLQKIRDHVTVSPNGVAFVKSSVRRGVLPIMVEEILNTRLMVKKSMKQYKDDKILSRMLDARQLGLKLIANVTYGYTGAAFSGRMPCVEVGDSIVRKARECLERAIELVRTTPKWRAHVVYGDTDSMFVHFPGRSKDEAFLLGQEIADAVTAMFPSPIKLRFEKIYLPCVLQTKKRYVGFMYETAEQKDPVYDAKGIETVRRDACSAVSKILERSIKVLFSTHDLSRVKAYVTRQMRKLLEGKVSVIDLIFAKEFRGMMGYKPGACVPALEIARKRVKVDRRSEPRVGERVPYVIVHGSPGVPLIQLVREPSELIVDTSLRLNATYYITKQILPPLDRIFALIGVSVFRWYQDMPKVVRVGPMTGAAPSAKQGTISQFFATSNCPICDVQTKCSVCERCGKDPQLVVLVLTTKIQKYEKTYSRLAEVCDTCQGTQDSEQSCVSIDCPIMFRRIIARQDLVRADGLQEVLTKYLQF